jgi:hypothetical protein
VHGLPPESATVRKLTADPGWSTEAYLLADLFAAFTGEQHPARPAPDKKSRYAEKRAALEAQRARVAAQSNRA